VIHLTFPRRQSPRANANEPLAPPGTIDDLVQARLAGRLGRRELIQRATTLGIAGPVLGIILHATSDHAFGVPLAAPFAAGTPTPSGRQPRPVAGPTRPPGPRRPGDTVITAAPREPDTLHPWLTATAAGFDVLDGVMDGLLRYDSKQHLGPALAESVAISDDGLTYTFHLRRDVIFHNGDRFTARDFAAAWKMKLDPAFAAANTLGWDKIAAVDTSQPNTLVVTISEPYAPFLSYVGTSYLCPSSALAAGPSAFRRAFDRAPIGTGPFRVTAWKSGDRIELARFDQYWGRRPAFNRVIYQIVPTLSDRLDGLQSGRGQVAGGAGAFAADQVDQALAVPGLVVFEHVTQNWQHLDLKQIGFLRETPVRQALDFATPKQRIIDDLLDGRALPAVADQAPGTWTYNASLKPRPEDPAKAAALLDAAGITIGRDGVRARDGQPFAMELWGIAGDPLAKRIIALIAASWNAIGVATTPRFGDAAALWGPMGYQFSDKMTACLFAWTNANDPDDMFYWNSSQIPTSPTADGGNLPAFFARYTFQNAIDALTARGVAETDAKTRVQLYGQIQTLLQREVPVIFLYWEQAFPAAAANLGGFWPSAFTGLLWNVQDWYLTDPSASTPVASPAATPVASRDGV